MTVGQTGGLICIGIGPIIMMVSAWMHRSYKPQAYDDVDYFNGWMLGIGFVIIMTGALMLVGLR